MTHNAADEDLRAGGDYVKLEDRGAGGGARCRADSFPSGCFGGGWWWWWAKIAIVVLFAAVLAAVFFKWVGPFIMDKEIIPILIWERETFSPTTLALMVFCSLAIFPSLLIPSSPSMWIAGMTFGYGYGFLLTIAAVSIGVSIPYFTGSLFCLRLHAWLEKYPKRAKIIRLAGEGDWLNQFRAVTLIRISPFPYIVYNYCAMATDVKYGPYLLGTIVGMVPEIFVALYTGILIKTLADASDGRRSLSALEICLNVFGFFLSVATTAIVTVYAKRRLDELQTQEVPLLK